MGQPEAELQQHHDKWVGFVPALQVQLPWPVEIRQRLALGKRGPSSEEGGWETGGETAVTNQSLG